jgi:hypothetical protein
MDPIKTIAIICVCFLYLAGPSCSRYPTDTSGRNLYEMESVWQYLKTYCIWQDTLWRDTLPVDAFKYATPEELLAGVHDTLKGPENDYTTYDSSLPRLPIQNSFVQPTALTPPEVIADSLTDSTGYIGIYSEFVAGQTYHAFLDAVSKVAKFPYIIIDLRYNRGGDIGETDSIIQRILPDSTPFILEKYRKYDSQIRQASTINWDTIWTNRNHQSSALYNKKYAVLVNRLSASASEILIAALKDGLAHTTLVGDTSYGKGMGQIVITREHIGRPNIKITFLRMKGLSDRVGYYHRKGIWPDVLVRNPSQSSVGDSLQLLAAMRVFQPTAILKKTKGLPAGNTGPQSTIAETSIIAPQDDMATK